MRAGWYAAPALTMMMRSTEAGDSSGGADAGYWLTCPLVGCWWWWAVGASSLSPPSSSGLLNA